MITDYDKTVDDSLKTLSEILGKRQDQLVTDTLVTQALAASQNRDKQTLGNILATLYKQVQSASGGLPLTPLDDDTFGKKIGWLLKDRTPDSIRTMLAAYQRELARPLLEQHVAYEYHRGKIKEVVRRAVGKTCPWCLERAGIWHPADANALGVWARHAGCDCRIYIRYVDESEAE